MARPQMKDSLKGIEPDDKATIEWLNSRKNARERNTYRFGWSKFLAFTDMTGEQILADRQIDCQGETYRWEHRIMDFKQWMAKQPIKKQQKGKIEYQSPNSVKTAVNVVRGFFSYYRKPLQLRRQESKVIKEAQRKTEDYKFSREDLKKMADVANLKEQYVLVVGKSFGLRISDFLARTRGDLEPYINREVPISIGKINTIKENVPAYPFIDTDAQPVIKAMLDLMTREGRTNPNEKMLRYQHEKECTQVLKRLAIRAVIQTGNKRVRFQCLRQFLSDNLASMMSESKWKQIVGKTISEGAYIGADSLREDYIRAMAKTTFITVLPQAQIELLAKKQALMILAKNANITEQEMGLMFQGTTLQEGVKKLEDAIEKKGFSDRAITSDRFEKQVVKGETNNCPDGEHCQRLVTEQELETLITQGWHVVVCLPSGKIVVSNEI